MENLKSRTEGLSPKTRKYLLMLVLVVAVGGIAYWVWNQPSTDSILGKPDKEKSSNGLSSLQDIVRALNAPPVTPSTSTQS